VDSQPTSRQREVRKVAIEIHQDTTRRKKGIVDCSPHRGQTGGKKKGYKKKENPKSLHMPKQKRANDNKGQKQKPRKGETPTKTASILKDQKMAAGLNCCG